MSYCSGVAISADEGITMRNGRAKALQEHSPDQVATPLLPQVPPQEQQDLNPQQQQQQQQQQQATPQKQAMSADEKKATKKSLVIVAGIFVASLVTMCYVYAIFPELNASEKQHLKIPRDIQDAKMLAKVLDRYKDMYYFEVMFGVVVAYVLYPFTKSKSTNPKYEKWHEKSVAD
uniref:Isoform B of Transmembrane protein 41 homolog n=1 Tax=Drosophila melanogaster TaxID=7227 RepID=Q9VX39-2|nr:stasimon, isoform B [Drosophila melanogaster]ACL82947.1 stasimon, isoform B [Drosophila melanogaster]|eukprot:NP_001138217.1 stasimon, isoform B [Drosophila melanogaster]